MRILIANGWLGGRSGSEVHTKDLALALHRRGHACTVFVGLIKQVDEDVRALRAAGVQVVDSLEGLETPDVIHAHHIRETTLACMAFPRTPAFQVCHDATHERDCAASPKLVQLWGAVDGFCQERVARETGLGFEQIPVLFNPADLALFPPRSTPPATPPRKALLFFSCVRTPSIQAAIVEACSRRGLELEVIGPGGRFEAEPHRILGDYDVVFGKARCAIEAMAAGAHVILCAPEGVGPTIHPDNFAALHRRNFGRSLLTTPLDAGVLEARILALDAAVTASVNQRIRTSNSAERLAEVVEAILLPLAAVKVDRPVLRMRLSAAMDRMRAWAHCKWTKVMARKRRA